MSRTRSRGCGCLRSQLSCLGRSRSSCFLRCLRRRRCSCCLGCLRRRRRCCRTGRWRWCRRRGRRRRRRRTGQVYRTCRNVALILCPLCLEANLKPHLILCGLLCQKTCKIARSQRKNASVCRLGICSIGNCIAQNPCLVLCYYHIYRKCKLKSQIITMHITDFLLAIYIGCNPVPG